MMTHLGNHNWKRAEDQTDVGTLGVRLVCTLNTPTGRFIQHVETVHYAFVDRYLDSGTSREDV